MSVIKRKSSKSSKEPSLGDLVDGIFINDENWRCIVNMLIESQEDQIKYTTMLNNACTDGYRKAIRCISREKMLSTLRPANLESLVAASATPSVQRIRQSVFIQQQQQQQQQQGEAANTAQDSTEEARLVKWMIYEVRLESLARRAAELELSAEREREQLALQQSPKEERAQQEKSAADIARRKPYSRLRKRGEEWRDRVYVDDAPSDGPAVYILLTGFRDPTLPLELVKLGVPLNCIFRLECQESCCSSAASAGSCDNCEESTTSSASLEQLGSSTFSSDSFKTDAEIKGKKPIGFWDNFEANELCDLIVRPYCPDWTPNSDSSTLYDGISYMLYSVHDTLQAHAGYLTSMRVMQVDGPRKPTRLIQSCYEDLMDSLPEEGVSVHLILEAMLQQVEENLENAEDGESRDRPNRESCSNDVLDSSSASQATTSLDKVNYSSAAVERLVEKLRLLNSKYELVSRVNGDLPSSSVSSSLSISAAEPKLILHGDLLRLNVCRSNEAAFRSEVCKGERQSGKFASLEPKLLEEPWINRAWRCEAGDDIKVCKEHFPGALKYCEKEGIDPSRAKHLLNLLGFKKLIGSVFTDCQNELNSENLVHRRIDDNQQNDESEKVFHELLQEKGIEQNENKMSSLNVNNKTTDATTAGDKVKNIDPGEDEEEKIDTGFEEAGMLLDCQCAEANNAGAILEARPSHLVLHRSSCLSSGVTSERHNSDKTTTTRRLSSLNLASGRELSSIDESGRLRSLERYVELLGLADESSTGKGLLLALEEYEQAELLGRRASRQIVQDCLQEYGADGVVARYFAPTDTILLLFCREPQQTCEIIERRVTCALRTPVCLADFFEYVMSDERDWLNRWQTTRAASSSRGRRILVAGGEPVGSIFRDEDFLLPGSLKAKELESMAKEDQWKSADEDGAKARMSKSVEKSKEVQRASASSNLPKRGTVGHQSRSDSSTSLSEGQAQCHEFIGYDLGGARRVYVSSLMQAYRTTDNSLLRLVNEQWLLASGEKRNTISVRIEHLEEEASGWNFWYHESELEAGRTSFFHVLLRNGAIVAFSKKQGTMKGLLYEFQISLPSGLIIKPVDFCGAGKCPFYIFQRLASKKPKKCNGNAREETHRKYLHNGDVVKFFNDGSVVVLRPNGIVISITDFAEGDDKSVAEPNDSLATEESLGRLRGAFSLHNEEINPAGNLPSATQCDCSSYSSQPQLRYVVLELDGRRYEVCDGQVVRVLDRLRSSLNEDYHPEEKFLRREDGTEALFTADAELIVDFPDGTRILSGCVVEAETVQCDWSAEELKRHFSGKELGPEGFVSILTRSRAEQPRYASVARDSSMPGTCLQLAANSHLHLKFGSQDFAELQLDERACVEVNADGVSMTRRSQSYDGSSSRVSFLHRVHSNSSSCCDSQTIDTNVLLTLVDESSRLYISRDRLKLVKVASSVACPSTCDCKNKSRQEPSWLQQHCCRLFALGRREAYEYRRRAEWAAYEERMMAEEGEASLICRPINRHSEMQRRIALRNLASVLGATSTEYEIPRAKPSAKYRVKLGEEEGHGLWDKAFRASRADQRVVRFLIARLLEDISRPGENSLIKMQRALGNYWREREVETGARTGGNEKKKGEATLMCDCQGEMETRMSDMAEGKTNTIDPRIYEAGRQELRRLKVEADIKRTKHMIDDVYKKQQQY